VLQHLSFLTLFLFVSTAILAAFISIEVVPEFSRRSEAGDTNKFALDGNMSNVVFVNRPKCNLLCQDTVVVNEKIAIECCQKYLESRGRLAGCDVVGGCVNEGFSERLAVIRRIGV